MKDTNTTTDSSLSSSQVKLEGSCPVEDKLERGDNGGARDVSNMSFNDHFLTVREAFHIVEDLQERNIMIVREERLLVYIFLVLLFMGLNVALMIANTKPQDLIEEDYYKSFHMASFWGVFLFTMLEALVLIATDTISWAQNPFQSALVLFNVMATFAVAFLFTFDPELFETAAHYMEYSVQVLISCVNIVFVCNVGGATINRDSLLYKLRGTEIVVAVLVLILSLLTILIYSQAFEVGMESERAAHFCEFANDLFNAIFALAYALLAYMDIRTRHQERMIGSALKLIKGS